MFLISAVGVLVGGFASAVQSPTNATLARYVGNLQATTISFGTATCLLVLAVFLFGSGSFFMIPNAAWWMVIGGFFGAFSVLIITISTPVLGVALTLTSSMLGQIFMGIIIDLLGWFRVDRSSLNMFLVAGFVLTAAGIVLVYISRQRRENHTGAITSNAILLLALTFLSGIGLSVQAPVNTALADIIGKLESSLISFFGGLLILFFATLILSAAHRKPPFQRTSGLRPWMFAGGLYGVFNVVVIIIATPYLGVALLVGVSMLGQLLGALIIDNHGLMRAEKIPPDRFRIIGIILIAAGAVLFAAGRF